MKQALVSAAEVLYESRDYYKAISSSDAEKQMKAKQKKLSALAATKTQIKVDRLKDRSIVSYKQIYKIKQNFEEIIERYKMRLIIRGFS